MQTIQLSYHKRSDKETVLALQISFNSYIKAAVHYIENCAGHDRIDVQIGEFIGSYFSERAGTYDSFSVHMNGVVRGEGEFNVMQYPADHLRMKKFDMVLTALHFSISHKLNVDNDAELMDLLIELGFSVTDAMDISKAADPLVG